MRWCSEIFLGAGFGAGLAFFGGESEKRKNPETIEISGFFDGAADQIRTGDLILTKDALYRLSYSSRLTSYEVSGDREGT